MKARFSVQFLLLLISVTALGYIGWVVSDQIVYRQRAQPIPFRHDMHAGKRKIACVYCHRGVYQGYQAGVPSVRECWACHRAMPKLLKDPKKYPGVTTLQQYWEAKKPIVWWKVYQLPDHVHFQHETHVARGIACTVCHGDVAAMPVVRQAHNPTMGWCVTCHRQQHAPVSCSTCHY